MRQVRACRTDFLNVIKRNYRGGSTLLHNNTGRSNEDIMLIRSRPVFKIQKKNLTITNAKLFLMISTVPLFTKN
jgi:hypothetical protein